MDKASLTYEAALGRLEQIVGQLEGGEIGVDALTAAVKEGVELVTFCRRRLRTAQQEVERALQGLTENAQGGANGDVGEEGLEPPTSSV